MLQNKEIIVSVSTAVFFTTIFFSMLRFLFFKWLETVSKDIDDLKISIKIIYEKLDKTTELCMARGEKIGEIEGKIKK